jgi:hypothetical protein
MLQGKYTTALGRFENEEVILALDKTHIEDGETITVH